MSRGVFVEVGVSCELRFDGVLKLMIGIVEWRFLTAGLFDWHFVDFVWILVDSWW